MIQHDVQRSWRHLYSLSLALGLFYTVFVLAVNYIERSWLQQPPLTPADTLKVVITWAVFVPSLVSSLLAPFVPPPAPIDA